jgi:hypothetical protein
MSSRTGVCKCWGSAELKVTLKRMLAEVTGVVLAPPLIPTELKLAPPSVEISTAAVSLAALAVDGMVKVHDAVPKRVLLAEGIVGEM